MSTVGRMKRASLVLPVSAMGVPCDQTRAADIPVNPDPSAEVARATNRVCTDFNGKTFRWHWANVPFATVCDADEAKDARPASEAPQPRKSSGELEP